MWWQIRKKVHVSWFLAVASLGIIVGVAASQYVTVFGTISWVFAGLGLLLHCLWSQRAYLFPLAFVAGGIIGLWRGDIDQSYLAPYQHLIGHTVTVTGVVTEDVDIGKHNERRIRLAVKSVDGNALPGTLWIGTSTQYDIMRSDIVTVSGKLDEGFGNFVASMYRADVTKVQRAQPGDIALGVRDYFADAVRLAIPDPEAALGIGYLVGQRRALPPELDEALQIAGLTHIVVASGYNLTILVRLARRACMKISRFTALAGASGLIVSFIAITGLSPSMSRAGLVAGLSLLAWYYGRKFHPLVLLPFAAAVTLLINPAFGWNDLGWQLSFAAFAGVLIVAPLAQAYFFGDEKPGTIRQILGETIAAQLCTLPIILVAFGEFSNVAIIANMLVVPFVPLAMLLTFVAGIGALIAPALALTVGWPATTLLHYMVTVAQHAAGLPWAQTQATIPLWGATVFYCAVAVGCWCMWRATRFDMRRSTIVE
ncbi:ComEC/Rec2 family competence protein [Streptomyces caniscabiei]|uniref:ComEC/Rec2 family competence protein n=1 Tax=Streptomyces caniscabiei TaxID=2746961 RepID=UPI0029A97145|nr:ComEC/Rec2 family competence protein [Streptomyces caniscabiei]MDX2776538.1 ComEC/Rec2 family competence protein [Streptomyces caniscabiei]